jgi:hypothetical protein
MGKNKMIKLIDILKEIDLDKEIETIGIIALNNKLLPAYFKNKIPRSLGDDVAFDTSGKLILPGSGYPQGGFKEHKTEEELTKDLCKNYDELLRFFRTQSPKNVELEEAQMKILTSAINCAI